MQETSTEATTPRIIDGRTLGFPGAAHPNAAKIKVLGAMRTTRRHKLNSSKEQNRGGVPQDREEFPIQLTSSLQHKSPHDAASPLKKTEKEMMMEQHLARASSAVIQGQPIDEDMADDPFLNTPRTIERV